MKYDTGKIKYGLIPPAALAQIAEVLTYGSRKYDAFNWKDVESYRYIDAAYRHLELAREGHMLDAESGLPHLAHAVTNLMFLLDRQARTGNNEFNYEEVYHD